MEEPVHEVAANSQVVVLGIGITLGCEETCLETVERISLPLAETAAREKPFLAFLTGLFFVATASESKGAVGNKGGNHNLRRLRLSGGLHCDF